MNKNEVGLAPFLPKLEKYDGIKALKESPYLFQIPSNASTEIGKILYEVTEDENYLDLMKRNIDASPDTVSYVSILSYCKPCPKLYNMLADIYTADRPDLQSCTHLCIWRALCSRGLC